jgi:hypothetical protein
MTPELVARTTQFGLMSFYAKCLEELRTGITGKLIQVTTQG